MKDIRLFTFEFAETSLRKQVLLYLVLNKATKSKQARSHIDFYTEIALYTFTLFIS